MNIKKGDEPEVVMVDEANEGDLPEDVRAELEAGQPSEMAVMKEVRRGKTGVPVPILFSSFQL